MTCALVNGFAAGRLGFFLTDTWPAESGVCGDTGDANTAPANTSDTTDTTPLHTNSRQPTPSRIAPDLPRRQGASVSAFPMAGLGAPRRGVANVHINSPARPA
jgi:hypothetical protein